MKDKLEQIFKFIPAATLLCYISGVIVIKSFLLEQEIYEGNIINIRFIDACLLYLVFVFFVIVMPLIFSDKNKYLITVITSLFSFYLLNTLFGSMNINHLLIAIGIVFIIISILYWFKSLYIKKYSAGKLDLGEISLRFFILFILSLLAFSNYFKVIPNNFGGGKSYKKVLFLKEKKDYLLKTDSLLKSDTLNVVYENDQYIYFTEKKLTKSIKKELIEGEMMVK